MPDAPEPFSKYLHRDNVILELKSDTRFGLIDEMFDNLLATNAIIKEVAFELRDLVKKREQVMSTGIGFGLAVPHSSSALINTPIIAVGRSTAGIQFEALDGRPVHIVFLLLTPASNRQQHLALLSPVSRRMHNSIAKTLMLKAGTTDDLLKCLVSGK